MKLAIISFIDLNSNNSLEQCVIEVGDHATWKNAFLMFLNNSKNDFSEVEIFIERLQDSYQDAKWILLNDMNIDFVVTFNEKIVEFKYEDIEKIRCTKIGSASKDVYAAICLNCESEFEANLRDLSIVNSCDIPVIEIENCPVCGVHDLKFEIFKRYEENKDISTAGLPFDDLIPF